MRYFLSFVFKSYKHLMRWIALVFSSSSDCFSVSLSVGFFAASLISCKVDLTGLSIFNSRNVSIVFRYEVFSS